MRSRVVLHRPGLGLLARALTALLLLAVLWYGLMVVLLAVKVSPATVNGLSADRTIFNWADNLRAETFTTPVRIIAGITGVLALLLFTRLALAQLPRPRFVRGGDLGLAAGEPGQTVVAPGVVERLAEIAATRHGDVASASGRLHQDSLDVDLGVLAPETSVETLHAVRAGVLEALERHGLPRLPVNVVLDRFDLRAAREPS